MTECTGLLDRLRHARSTQIGDGVYHIASPDEMKRTIQRLLSAYPRRDRTEIDVLADDIERLRAEIAAQPKRKRAPPMFTAERGMKLAAKYNASLEIDPASGKVTLKPGAANGNGADELPDDLRELI